MRFQLSDWQDDVEDGRIRVHCYHKDHDEPTNVEIYPDHIQTWSE